MWFAVGFTAACAVGVYLADGIWLLLLALFALAVGVALFFLKTSRSKPVVAVLLGCTVGFVWLFGHDFIYLSGARALDGQTVELSVQVSDFSYDSDYGIVADGSAEYDGISYRMRVYLPDMQPLAPGDQISGPFRLRYTADGGEQAPTYHQGKGIILLAYSTDQLAVTRNQEVPLRYYAAVLRKQITQILDSIFPADTVAFARALLLGDSSQLSYQVDTDFQTSGIRHVIAVSGLHVSILFALVYTLAGKRRGLTALLGIPALILFAAVAGFTPSINRACIMQALMILSMLLNREHDPPTALSFAVLVMLAANPLTITSVSFQLSVGCMVGIFLLSGRISGYLLDEKRLGPAKGKGFRSRLIRWSVGSVSVTLSAMTTTVPLCAWYFGAVSIIGILTNLLTLWVISFIFYGIMAACVAGAFWLPAGSFIAWCISWPMRYVLLTARILSSFPIAAVYTCSMYTVAWLIFCYILLTVFLFSKEKHPALFACCLALSLAVSVLASWAEPVLDRYRMTVLDVGQGQCILLQCGQKRYLVDCGGDTDASAADAAAELLLSQCVTELDGVILTHYDADHAAGLSLLLSRVSADTLYLPDVPDKKGIRDQLVQQYADTVVWVEPDSVTQLSNIPITLFAAKPGETENESSLCVLFQPENCDILITGDRDIAGENALMAQTDLPEVEILVVGHHGAKNATGMQLLKKTNPVSAVISVGLHSAYDHPSQDVLYRLSLFGCEVYRTDRDGTIIFRG
jgi:competence protein ComEC